MRALRPLPPDLSRRIGALARGWSGDPDIAAVYLFGSRGRGAPAPTSDVDLAVTLRADFPEADRLRKRLALIGTATAELGTDAVDVILLDEASSLLGHRVIRDGKVLCERDPRRRAAAAEGVLRRYLDEAPIRQSNDRALARRVAEGRFAR